MKVIEHYWYSVLVVAAVWYLCAFVYQWFDARNDPFLAGMMISGLSLIWPILLAFIILAFMISFIEEMSIGKQ